MRCLAIVARNFFQSESGGVTPDFVLAIAPAAAVFLVVCLRSIWDVACTTAAPRP
jgi:hypothetical protein